MRLIIEATGAKLREVLELLFGWSSKAAKISFCRATINKQTIKGDIMALILSNTQEVDLAIQPLDKRGRPAQVDGVPEWAASDPTKATLVVAEDGLSAVLKALDNGTIQVGVVADADLGEGVQTITGLLDVEIVGGQAATLGIIAGTPREQQI